MKTPRRFFVPPESISADRVILRGSDVGHIRDVLRLRPGDPIHVLDGRGTRYEVRLRDVSRDEVMGEIISRREIRAESPVSVILGQAVIKGCRFDDVVRQATELGARRIVPLQTDRTVARISASGRDGKIERWRRIAREASKQCGRGEMPTVENAILTVERFCGGCRDCGLKLIFWEEEDTVRPRDLQAPGPFRDIAVLIGPEGGLSAAEAETARAHGFLPVTLGRRKLRAETATVAALAIVQNLWGDL
jgi:16S rRNA (uracil1498-N3)-methyltransferase